MKIYRAFFLKHLFWKKTLTRAGITAIEWYQKLFSPDHGMVVWRSGHARCRFYPSCSAYAIASIRQYGLFIGTMSSVKRIMRCNPFFRGGYDPI